MKIDTARNVHKAVGLLGNAYLALMAAEDAVRGGNKQLAEEIRRVRFQVQKSNERLVDLKIQFSRKW